MSANTVLLLPHQERFVQSPNLFPDIRWHFLLGGYGCGKMEWVEQIIPTPDGPRRFGDLKVGDTVFAANGEPTKVTGVFPKGRQDAYKITFSDGRSDICGKEHLWGVYYYSHSDYKYKVIELGEMLKKGVRRPDARYTKAGGKPRYWIPASPVCYYPDKELPVDPYALGSLIGNGCLTLPYLTISSNDEWQVAKVAARLKTDYKKRAGSYSWVLYHNGHLIKTQNAMPKSLCCLAGEKFIPDVYKTAGIEQRKELLQGLFDTDGSVDNSGNRLHVTYTTVSQRLAEDIREVLLSLGIVSTIRVDRREGRNDCYVLLVNCAQEQKAWLFSLPRKLERVTSFKRADKRDYSRVAVYSIEKLQQQLEMQCIMVDNPAHLYLTNEHIVTHNTRSLAISALKIIEELDGDKDEGGLYAKVIVAGYTYAHLEQTFLIDFRAYLDNSKTPYHEDTKNHIFTVGTVQVVLIQLLEPGKIFGQSVYCALCVDGDAIVKVHTMSGRVQEVPLKQIAPGDLIMTRYGLKKVTAKKCSGYRPCIKTNGVYTTLNHPFKVYNTRKHREEVRAAHKLDEDCMLIHEDNTLSSVFQDKTLVEKEVWDITVDEVHEYLVKGTDKDCQYLSIKNCDEVDELPEDVMIEAMKSVSQRVRQIMPEHRSPYIMSASTAQGMKGFYRLYCHYKKSGIGFVLVRARTQDNWYLPKEYILDLWKNFTPTERKVYMEGAFLSVTQGRVIPGFDWDRNFIPESDMDLELLPGERIYIGFDWNTGYNRGSAWVARNGTIYCVKYYDFPDPMEAPKTFRYDFPEQDIFWIPDVTAKDSFPHYGRELRKNDVHIIFRSKSPLVEDSCFLISKLCAQGRIKITSQAKEIAEAFSTASRDKDNKIPKGIGPNSPIHAIDGARYACSYMAMVLPEFKDIRRGIMSHLASFRAGAEEMEERLSAVADMGAGYSRIEGRAFAN